MITRIVNSNVFIHNTVSLCITVIIFGSRLASRLRPVSETIAQSICEEQ